MLDEELNTFEAYLAYQAVGDPEALTEEQRVKWRQIYEEVVRQSQNSKVGLMSLRPVANEQKYAVAIHDSDGLWLTLWVRCSPKGDVYVMIPRADRTWNPHTSYHRDGRVHSKSHDQVILTPQQRQPLDATFRGTEHLGYFAGHSKSTGAVCDAAAFTDVVRVPPGVLAAKNGFVAVDLLESGDVVPIVGEELSRHDFMRPGGRPAIVIRIGRSPDLRSVDKQSVS
jgi:hypothetical protein